MIRRFAALALAAFLAASPARAGDPVSLELIFETGSAPAQEVAEIFRARLDPYAPDTQIETKDNRVRVFFWGVQEPDWMVRHLSASGAFGLHEVTSEAANCEAPPSGLTCAAPIDPQQSALLLRPAALTNRVIAKAEPGFDHYGLPVVNIRLNADGARAFGELTARLIGQRIAIVYEGRVLLAPVVREPILGGAMMISGNFTSEEVSDLAVMLSASKLPDSVSLISQRTGPVAEPPKKSLLQRLFD